MKRSVCFEGSSFGGFFVVGRCKSGGDSDSAFVVSSSVEEESSGGGSVTLDFLEYAWMFFVSDGKWDGLEGLFICEFGLLVKRDFIIGFICLYWVVKYGR